MISGLMSLKNSGRQRTKRCHWVPQSYLRTFAANPPARSRIWRLSKHHNGPDAQLKPIKKVAMGFHLYAPRDPVSGVRDDSFERRLSDLEQWFGDPVWHALCYDYVDLSWDPLRKMVSLLVAVMQFRNPSHFEIHKQIHQRIVKQVEQFDGTPTSVEIKGKVYPIAPGSWSAYRAATEDDVRRNWLQDVGTCAWYAEHLMKMRWAILVSEEPLFITTDNPVAILHPSLEFRGINNPETSVTFPLSPTRALCMDHLHHEPANQYYPLKGDGSVVNLLLWRQANEYMFSHRHTDEVCQSLVSEAEKQGFA